MFFSNRVTPNAVVCGKIAAFVGGGSIMGETMDTTKTCEIRFWTKVERKNSDECWEWKGAKDTYGYGNFWSTRHIKAHRFAYESAYGPAPSNLCVCHKCDNPGCVNPNHMFLGTKKDNNADKDKKGRGNRLRGEKAHNSKLTADQIVDIRKEYAGGKSSINKLSKKYGMSNYVIHQIIRRERWKHIA